MLHSWPRWYYISNGSKVQKDNDRRSLSNLFRIDAFTLCACRSSYDLHFVDRWSVIASNLPGRTDNDVKNYWNTRLKKKLLARRIPTGDTDMANANANANPNPSTSGKIGISRNRLSSSFPKPSTSTLPHLPHPSSSQPNFFSPVSSLPSLTEVSDNTGSVASANMDYQVSSSQEFSSSFGSSSSITEESYSRLSIDNLLDLDFGVMYDILSSGFGFEQGTGNRTSVVSTLKVSDA